MTTPSERAMEIARQVAKELARDSTWDINRIASRFDAFAADAVRANLPPFMDEIRRALMEGGPENLDHPLLDKIEAWQAGKFRTPASGEEKCETCDLVRNKHTVFDHPFTPKVPRP